MTCTRFENDLALYVERDLPSAEVPAVEAHLGECAECRRFLDGLRASQLLVRGVAAEEIGGESLSSLRERVMAAALSPEPSRGHPVSRALWAAAAVVVVGFSGVAWMRTAGQDDRAPRVVQGPAPTEPSRPQRPTRLESTPPPVRGVSHDVKSARAGRTGVGRTDHVPALSRDDADQLARAVVVVSQIRSAHDRPAEPEPSPEVESTPLMRVATSDPDVVIYWQLEPNGGE
jgi:hypothetical protein